MQALCAYETVALGYSEFCNLFTEDEWKGYEYGLGELWIWAVLLKRLTRMVRPRLLVQFRSWHALCRRAGYWLRPGVGGPSDADPAHQFLDHFEPDYRREQCHFPSQPAYLCGRDT